MKRTLKPDIIQRLRRDESIQFRLATALHRKFRTIERWVRENDDMLTSPAALLVIKEAIGLDETELVEESQPEPAKAPA